MPETSVWSPPKVCTALIPKTPPRRIVPRKRMPCCHGQRRRRLANRWRSCQGRATKISAKNRHSPSTNVVARHKKSGRSLAMEVIAVYVGVRSAQLFHILRLFSAPLFLDCDLKQPQLPLLSSKGVCIDHGFLCWQHRWWIGWYPKKHTSACVGVEAVKGALSCYILSNIFPFHTQVRAGRRRRQRRCKLAGRQELWCNSDAEAPELYL